MFSSDMRQTDDQSATRLTLEDLTAIQPRHVRGRWLAGRRGPDGERPGRGRSATLDFDGLSPYALGDDVRTIDWRASLRSGQTTVRRFAASSHRAHMLIVDLRPDLYFGTADRLMAKTACLAAAWEAWQAFSLHEPVGLSVGALTIRPRRGRRHVLHLLDVLVQSFAQPVEAGALPEKCEAAAALTSQRDEIHVVSDLPADPAGLIAVGRVLSSSRTLRLLLVEDGFVTKAPAPGRYPVRGPDGQRRVITVSGGLSTDQKTQDDLSDAGWRIQHAMDLLPRENGS